MDTSPAPRRFLSSFLLFWCRDALFAASGAFMSASILQTHPDAVLLLDEAAAALL